MPEWVITVLAVVAVVIPAAMIVRASILRASNNEWRQLAESRGQRIDDLVEEMATLQERMGRLESRMEVIQEFKAHEIATMVVARLMEAGGVPWVERPAES